MKNDYISKPFIDWCSKNEEAICMLLGLFAFCFCVGVVIGLLILRR